MNVLIAEDEQAMAELLESALAEEGHSVTLAAAGDLALSLAASSRFDLMILDLMLPVMDGFRVAQRLRSQGIRTPILVLTARDHTADVVKALDSGADDYLTKPFALEELLARVRAVSRRGEIPQGVQLQAGHISLNTATREVLRRGSAVSLTPREYSLLELLLKHKGHVLSRSFLVDSVWGFAADIEENTLDAFIRLLRNKVEEPGMPKLIRTVRGIGYVVEGREL